MGKYGKSLKRLKRPSRGFYGPVLETDTKEDFFVDNLSVL